MAGRSLIGTRVAGRFRIVDKLGEGAMAQVFLAEHDVLGRNYAIKILRPRVQAFAPFVERFRREARAASRLHHPSIVHIHDFGQTDDGRFYIVMELVPGQGLRAAMEEAQGGLLPLVRALDILRQIARAVEAAHQTGVVHRDLKPENILLCRKHDGGVHVKILDFGMAKILEDPDLPQLTRRGEIFGTPAYMSPEQGTGRPVDERTDIYALGVLAFEMLTGRLPFEGNSLPEILMAQLELDPPRPSTIRPIREDPVPDELDRLVTACLDRDRHRRPASVRAVAVVLEGLHERLKEAAPSDAKLPTPAALRGESQDEVWEDLVTKESEQPTGQGMQLSVTNPSFDGKQSGGSMRKYLWDQICKAARSLALAMRDMRLGSVELTKSLGSLGEAEDEALAVDTERALLVSRLEDLEEITQKRKARLRDAVVDLSMERGRLVSEGAGDAQALDDLDRHILQLEGRLAELMRDQKAEHDRITAAIARTEEVLAGLQQAQLEREVALLRLLREQRPSDAPQAMQAAFDELEKLVACWE